MIAAIETLLVAGRTVLLDGGTGTDIQRRGAPMHSQVWCAEANLTHPEVVEAVHADYIRAGADIITANTFATSPLLFSAIGRASALKRIDRIAVEIASEARKRQGAERRVAIAGSFSTMRPMRQGSDRIDLERSWSEAEARKLMQAKAESLAEAGVDLILMEMMRDGDYALWATQAAVATGLPVWLGISIEQDETGRLTGMGRADWSYEHILDRLLDAGARVVSLMHTLARDIDSALPMLQARWRGPIGIYPEAGHFEMPNWQFDASMTPEAFVEHGKRWRRAGAIVLGGCCGIGPDHIRALAEARAAGML
jgi:homocysteine S-methyltransferase